jgi:putative PEP-CTERM system histidine kinase
LAATESTLIGVVSAGIGVLAWLVLALLLIAAARTRTPQNRALVLASLLSALWLLATGLIEPLPGRGPGVRLVGALEWWRSLAWIGFLLTVLPRLAGQERQRRRLQILLLLLTALGALACLLAPMEWIHGGARPRALACLLASIATLVLLEQVLRETPVNARWGLKFLVVALGASAAYDFFLYAEAVLLRGVDAHLWAARGAIGALVTPLIALAARRNPDWHTPVYVSRDVVFHSTTLLAAGLYLVAMGVAGYWVREAGGTWGEFLQTGFWFGGLVVMTLAVTSGELRSRARVLLAKHFYRNKYDYREEWLRLTHRLAGAPGDFQGVVDSVLEGVARLVEAQGAALWLTDERGQFVEHRRRGLEWSATGPEPLPAEHPLPRFLRETGWVVILDEWRNEPSRYPGLALPGWLLGASDVSLIVPLLAREHLVGFLLLGRSLGARRFDWEDSDLLKAVGRQAAGHLVLALTSDALSRSRQFEAYHRLSAFLVHDLKNVVAQLQLIGRNAERHAHNPEFVRDAFETVGHAVDRMNRMLANLRTGGSSATSLRDVPLEPLVERVLARLPAREPVPRLLSVLHGQGEGSVARVDPQALASVLEHLVQNAQDATPPDGEVLLAVESNAEAVTVQVRDNGCGMDAHFVAERLFRPFDTTKGNAGMGIGAFESRELVQAMGGRLEVESAPGQGTCFRVVLPRVVEQSEREVHEG